MKNKRIGHISKILAKLHDIFAENLTISFKNAKNRKLSAIQNCKIP